MLTKQTCKTKTSTTFSCGSKSYCKVPASTHLFGNPCPGTLKYLEAHYQCVKGSKLTTNSRNRRESLLVLFCFACFSLLFFCFLFSVYYLHFTWP